MPRDAPDEVRVLACAATLASVLARRRPRRDAVAIAAALPRGTVDVAVVQRGQRMELRIPEVVVAIQGLPGTYSIATHRALKRPIDAACKLYYRAFGAWCGATIASRRCTDPIPLAPNAWQVTEQVVVRCVPLHAVHSAATRISRFWRPTRGRSPSRSWCGACQCTRGMVTPMPGASKTQPARRTPVVGGVCGVRSGF